MELVVWTYTSLGTYFVVADGPGRWVGWAGPGQRLGDMGGPEEVKIRNWLSGCADWQYLSQVNNLPLLYVRTLTVGESTDIDSVSLLQVFGYIIVSLQCQTASRLPVEFTMREVPQRLVSPSEETPLKKKKKKKSDTMLLHKVWHRVTYGLT